MIVKKQTKKAVQKFTYSCSVYIRRPEDLQLLKAAAEVSRDSLSPFVLKAALREARRLTKSAD